MYMVRLSDIHYDNNLHLLKYLCAVKNNLQSNLSICNNCLPLVGEAMKNLQLETVNTSLERLKYALNNSSFEYIMFNDHAMDVGGIGRKQCQIDCLRSV